MEWSLGPKHGTSSTPQKGVRERFLSSLLSPTVLFFSPNPLLPSAPVADGGSLPVGRHPLCSRVQPLSLSNFDFSTSSLLICSGSSSVSGRIWRTKPVSKGVLSFPGEMARSWMVGSEDEGDEEAEETLRHVRVRCRCPIWNSTRCPCGGEIMTNVSPTPKYKSDFDTLPGSRTMGCTFVSHGLLVFSKKWSA
ncbi:hypothetical protein DY000_02062855 [Brassica cretica]|uniref:SWIM-type domain-containing protein n=1 Tax=Brassica cretica TaxID=69181 RepID=A0ABQ7B4C8_BRACR|nr:hypothetical protein DY000_02062855 [Brassica cretica]